MRRPAALAFGLVALCMASLVTAQQTAPAVPGRRAPRERAVAPQGDGDRPLLKAPEDLESRIFFSDRPPSTDGARERAGAELLERMLRQREALVVERRREAIAQLRTFIGRRPEDSVQMADALLRLAELTWEQARLVYLEAYQDWQQQPERSRPPPTCASRWGCTSGSSQSTGTSIATTWCST